MTQKKEVTFAVRMLLNHMRRLSEGRLRQDRRMTPMQGRVIGYLSCHSETNVYQRDLEHAFQIRRSTISAILQTMERNGLITRESVPQDARLKKLVLTPEAVAINDRFINEMERVEAIVTEGVSRLEMEAFFATVAKFEENMRNNEAVQEEAAHSERRGEEKE